jgi:hypothetical protein
VADEDLAILEENYEVLTIDLPKAKPIDPIELILESD